VSTLGSTISTLALPLLVLTLTHSAAQAGFIAAAQAIPYIVLGLPAGALIDRWDRKAVMIRCDVARALALGSVPLTATWGRLTTAQLYVVALVTGTALVFFNIAQTAALTRVVSGEQLPRATALDRTADSVAALIGPGVGGFLRDRGDRRSGAGHRAASRRDISPAPERRLGCHQSGRPHLQRHRPVLPPDADPRCLTGARDRCLPAAEQRRAGGRLDSRSVVCYWRRSALVQCCGSWRQGGCLSPSS